MRVLELQGDPGSLGETHGSAAGEMIRAYLADRLALSGDSLWSGQTADADTILKLADSTVEHHRAYSGPLFEEMTAMATTAGITQAEAVVVGGFTDLIDLVRSGGRGAPVIDECTAVLDPGAGVYAQTWDMHASAGEFVLLLHIEPSSGPSAFVQTTAGCLGQIGLNEAGIGIGINNLTSYGRPGVTWPFVVRKVLQQTDLDDAIKCVLDAEVAGGHNFMIIGPDGTGANIEAMPGRSHVTRIESAPFAHTNHCIDTANREIEGSRTHEHVVSSDLRLELGLEHAGDLDSFFAEPAIAKGATDPHLAATCGAVIMNPAQRRMEAVWGVPGEHPWEAFQL